MQKRSKNEQRNVPTKTQTQKVTISLPTGDERVSSKTIESIIKQANKNIESVTLVRSTHHVPEQREDLIFAIEYKQESK